MAEVIAARTVRPFADLVARARVDRTHLGTGNFGNDDRLTRTLIEHLTGLRWQIPDDPDEALAWAVVFAVDPVEDRLARMPAEAYLARQYADEFGDAAERFVALAPLGWAAGLTAEELADRYAAGPLDAAELQMRARGRRVGLSRVPSKPPRGARQPTLRLPQLLDKRYARTMFAVWRRRAR